MRNLFALAALAFSFSAALFGQEQFVITRIAVFSPERVVDKSPKAQKIFQEMQDLKKKLGDEIKGKSDRLVDLDNKLKSPSLSEDARAKLMRELQDGELSLKRLQEDSNAKFQKAYEIAEGKFEKDIKPILDAITKELKIQLLMRADRMMIPMNEASFFAFSDEVARRYDGSARSASSAAPPKPTQAPVKKTK